MRSLRIISILGVISFIAASTYVEYSIVIPEVARKTNITYLIHATPIAVIILTILLWLLLTIVLAIILRFMKQSAIFIDVFTSTGMSFYGQTIYYIIFLTARQIMKSVLVNKVVYFITIVISGILIAYCLNKLCKMSISKSLIAGILTTLIVYAIEIVLTAR